MAVDYEIIACLFFWRAWVTCLVSHPTEAFWGGGWMSLIWISKAVLKKWPYACGCSYFTILYCNFSCRCHSFNLSSRHLSKTSSVLCCRFKATLLVGILPYMMGHDYEYDTWYDYEHIQPSSILKYYETPPLLSSFLLSSVTYVLFWAISRKKIMYIYTYLDPDISFNDASNSIYNESIGDNSVQGCVFVGNICCLSHSLP